MDYSKIILKIRKDRGLTQSEFASMMGCTETFISNIETGSRKPSSKFLDRLSYETKIPMAFMVWMTLEEKDVPFKKRDFYRALKPVIDSIVDQLIIEED